MARTIAAAALRDGRRDAFVDAALRLIQAQGYERTSIQDVLDELDASRGAFYHYFDSKSALLDAAVERMVDLAIAEIQPIVETPGLDARDRLRALFGGIGRWKGERTDLMLALMDTWLNDDNALTREKFRRGLVQHLGPLLARIIEQGNVEGTLDAGDPEPTSQVLVALIAAMNERASHLYAARRAGTVTFEHVERTFGAFARAIERILGLPGGSLTLGDPATLRYWFDSPTPRTQEVP